MNKFQILVILAQFSKFYHGFDQFVIQQEQKVRKIENRIEKNKEVETQEGFFIDI